MRPPPASMNMNELSPIGLNAPLRWRETANWATFAEDEDVFEFLVGAGMRHVEYAVESCLDADEASSVLDQAGHCATHGLGIFLHPYFNGHNPADFGRGPGTAKALEAVLSTAAKASEITRRAVVVVIHPATSKCNPTEDDVAEVRRELLATSQRYFRLATELLGGWGGDVVVVAEYQLAVMAGENLIRIGDNAAELMQVSRGGRVPLCLDIGHYILSIERRGQPQQPPAELLQRVAHVHLHDVVGGRDHQPICEDSSLVAGYIGRLWRMGYRGPITLEYEGGAVANAGGIRAVVTESMNILRAWAKSAGDCGPAA